MNTDGGSHTDRRAQKVIPQISNSQSTRCIVMLTLKKL
jgi:hypothetical protein